MRGPHGAGSRTVGQQHAGKPPGAGHQSGQKGQAAPRERVDDAQHASSALLLDIGRRGQRGERDGEDLEGGQAGECAFADAERGAHLRPENEEGVALQLVDDDEDRQRDQRIPTDTGSLETFAQRRRALLAADAERGARDVAHALARFVHSLDDVRVCLRLLLRRRSFLRRRLLFHGGGHGRSTKNVRVKAASPRRRSPRMRMIVTSCGSLVPPRLLGRRSDRNSTVSFGVAVK